MYRLAEISTNIIDQCVAQGVPFAREYGGLLDNRSFGGTQVARTFYARGQTGQQLELGAYQALSRQIELGSVQMYSRHEMLELVIQDGRAAGIVVRDLVTGEISSHSAHAVVLATGGYGNVFYLSTGAKGCNATAIWRAHRKGAYFANPCYTQIHPTCIPVSGDHQSKLTLMSESLRNDGRIWSHSKTDETRPPEQIPENERDYYLERRYPAFANLVPRDVASRAAKKQVDEGYGVGPLKNGVYLDFSEAIQRLGRATIEQRYGNLFEMYEKITGEDPYRTPMRIYPAVHYTMGGLWVDYNLMSNIPGLFVIGEANFSDHGANRLGASALMQGLADGYFVLPSTITGELAGLLGKPAPDPEGPAFKEAEATVRERISQLLSIKGTHTVDYYHRKLGRTLWDYCGMSRTAEGLTTAKNMISEMREEYLAGCEGARRWRVIQSIAGEGGTRWRLFRTGGTDVPGRTRAGGIVRRALPRGTPDPGRRSAARRRELLLRGGVGILRRGKQGDGAQRAARIRICSPGAKELQVTLSLTLKVWRQKSPQQPGAFETYEAKNISEDMSFLEMLDVVNEDLIANDREPIAFDHDCREGICGMCGVVINGRPHGPNAHTTTCQLHMRFFKDGDTITVEPWRATAFPVIKDLVVNRTAFDKIIQAGGYITAPTGGAPDGNSVPCRRPSRTLPWTRLSALAVGRAWRPAQTALHSCSPRPSWPT